MAILDITTYAGPYPSGWGLLDDDAQTINDADTSTLPQARITALKMYETAGAAGGGGGLNEVVDDTTPQLGGNLDVNGNKIVSTSNGDIDIEPSGTGDVLLGNLTFDADQTVGAGQDDYVLTYDDGTGTIGLEASSGGGGGGGSLQYTELLSVTPSSETEFNVDCTGYGMIRIEYQNIDLSASDSIVVRVSDDGGSTYDSGATDYRRMQLNDDTNNGADVAYLQIGAKTNQQNDHYGICELSGLNNANVMTMGKSFAGIQASDSTWRLVFRKSPQADDFIKIFCVAGANFGTSGRVRVLGVGKTTVGGSEGLWTERTTNTALGGTLAAVSFETAEAFGGYGGAGTGTTPFVCETAGDYLISVTFEHEQVGASTTNASWEIRVGNPATLVSENVILTTQDASERRSSSKVIRQTLAVSDEVQVFAAATVGSANLRNVSLLVSQV